jgi:hypothetical protein
VDVAVIAKRLEGNRSRHGDRGSLFEGEIGRLDRQRIFRSGRILGKGTAAPAEHLVARPESCHGGADGFYLARHIRASNPVLWGKQPIHGRRAGDVRQAAHDRPVGRIDGGGPNANQDVVLADCRLGGVPDLQDLS